MFGTSRTFRTFFDNSDYFWRIPKTTEDSWGLQKIRRLPKLSVHSRRYPKTRILLRIGRNKRLQPLWAQALSSGVIIYSDFPRAEKNCFRPAWPWFDVFCPSCARNVRNLNHRQKSLWYCENRLWILWKLRARLFVYAIIFQESDFKLPDIVKSVETWTILAFNLVLLVAVNREFHVIHI